MVLANGYLIFKFIFILKNGCDEKLSNPHTAEGAALFRPHNLDNIVPD